MSLQPQVSYMVPEETARVARAIFPTGNIYMRLYDTFGPLFQDRAFAALFPRDGQPAEAPGRVVLVLVLQFAEDLTDRQAADAVRTRIDWKYLLGLELTDPGFDHTVLSEFRTRLVAGAAEQIVLDTLLTHFRDHGLITPHGQQRTDSRHVLAAIRAMTRLECVGETMRHALNLLAVADPAWMRTHSQPDWVDRYGSRVEDYHLPTSKAERAAYADIIGADGLALLNALDAPTTPAWMRELPAVETLRLAWVQNYTWTTDGCLRWRASDDIPPTALFISSPYDRDAHYSKKRSTSWVGYKVHLTETCDDELPRLITHVETTAAPVDDGAMTTPIHAALKAKDLLPTTHSVDTGYIDAELLVTSTQKYGVDLVGPTRDDCHWQARAAEGFAAADFAIDWERQQAICPAGHTSVSWTPAIDQRTNDVIKIKFATTECGTCSLQPQCTHSTPPRRTLTIRPEEQYKALQAARAREKTDAFTEQYARRAGVEGTLSQGIRAFGLRRARYIGQAKVHLQHILTAAAMDMVRVIRWLDGEPLAQTRQSAFVRLHKAAA